MAGYLVSGIIVALFIVISIFCYVMKKHDKKKFSQNHIDQNFENKQPDGKDSGLKSIIKKILLYFFSVAHDTTFLFFKLVGFIPVHFIRNFFYRYIFHMTIGDKAVIYSGLEARCPWNIIIGKGSVVGDKAILDARYGIEIGENVNISSGAWIWTLQHDLNSPTFTSEGQGGRVTIGDRSWISSRTTILPGCTVHEGCVLAAGAVLTKSTDEEFSVYGGVPAKKIGKRNRELTYVFNGQHRRFL